MKQFVSLLQFIINRVGSNFNTMEKINKNCSPKSQKLRNYQEKGNHEKQNEIIGIDK